jgi:hypothetical protein
MAFATFVGLVLAAWILGDCIKDSARILASAIEKDRG